MQFTTEQSKLAGAVRIPASKSHTVRAVIFATLAEGQSVIRAPLVSGDTQSALAAGKALGAGVEVRDDAWVITGTGGRPRAEGQTIDVGNSGTTLYIALGTAALARDGVVTFDGDEQIRRRSAGNLLDALRSLGVDCRDGGDGCCPIELRGPLRGGSVTIECPTSQYLTSLLMCAPLGDGQTHIDVPLLYEEPYVEMTLRWLKELGVEVQYSEDLSSFDVVGGQSVAAFDRYMAGDFSSATFFLVAAAITGSEVLLEGLDMTDSQGDKAVVEYLRAMGATITQEAEGLRVAAGARLNGVELDLNATPDALPAMAIAGAFAGGTTRLTNVPQARIKETDRIAVMAQELAKVGIAAEEEADGLVVHGGTMQGGTVHGHGDHRIVMSFAIAGLAASGAISVDTAESAAITVPRFPELVQALGGTLVKT